MKKKMRKKISKAENNTRNKKAFKKRNNPRRKK